MLPEAHASLLLVAVILVVCVAATALLLFRVWHRSPELPPRLRFADRHPRPKVEAAWEWPDFSRYRARPFDWSIDG